MERTMVSTRYKLPLLVVAVALLGVVGNFVFHPGHASATVSNEFINPSNTTDVPGDPWYDAYETVAMRGQEFDSAGNLTASIGLEARVSLARIFYNIGGPGATSRNTFTIRVLDACGPNQVFNGDIVVSLQNFSSSGTWTNLPGRGNWSNTNPANCSGIDMVFTVNRSELSQIPSYYGDDYGIVQVRVEKVNRVGTKMFRVISEDDGLVTFSELERAQTANPGNPGYGTAFSVQDANGPPSEEREYSFTFSPDCRYVPDYGTNGYLKWFDADFGDPNEFNTDNITFTLTRRNRVTGQVTWTSGNINQSSSPDIGGDDQFREMQFPITGPDDVFEWHWYNVNRNNGIQLWMPFSEMQYNITALSGCDVPPNGQIYTASCTTVSGWAADPDQPNRPLLVVVTQDDPYGAGGAEIGRVLADQPDGAGHGNHAFTLQYFGTQDAAVHTVYATAFGLDDNNQPVYSAPFQLLGSPIPVGPCATPEEFRLEPTINTVNFTGDEESPVAVLVNSTVIPSGVTQAAGIQGTFTRYLTIRRASGAVNTTIIGSTTTRVTSGGETFADNVSLVGQNVQAGDLVCAFILAIDTYHGMADVYGNVTSVIERQKISNSVCQRIVSKPYLKAFSGDVRAGGNFGAGVCSPDVANATIKTFAKDAGGGGQGASVEFAAFALGTIDYDTTGNGFFSASQRSTLPNPITGLTFANTVGGWGGNFGAADHCIPDFANITKGGAVAALPSTDLSTLPSGQYTVSAGAGPVRLTASGDIRGRIVVYVQGDVFIQKAGASPGVRYNAASWASTNDVPSLAIISEGGNIYTDYNISQLDGMYIAQTDPGDRLNTGMFYSCADPATALPFDSVAQAARFYDNANGCAKSALVVNGAVIAREVRLQRALGSLRNAVTSPGENLSNTTAAEVLNLSPELYIATPPWQSIGGTNGGYYDSLTSLPPTF